MTLARKNLCQLKHLSDVQRALEVLNRPYQLGEVKQHMQKIVFDTTKRTKLLSRYKVFQITWERKLSQLRSLVSENIYIAELNYYKALCKETIDSLMAEKEAILSGTRKNELADDWLISIAERMDSFLSDMFAYIIVSFIASNE